MLATLRRGSTVRGPPGRIPIVLDCSLNACGLLREYKRHDCNSTKYRIFVSGAQDAPLTRTYGQARPARARNTCQSMSTKYTLGLIMRSGTLGVRQLALPRPRHQPSCMQPCTRCMRARGRDLADAFTYRSAQMHGYDSTSTPCSSRPRSVGVSHSHPRPHLQSACETYLHGVHAATAERGERSGAVYGRT